MKYRMSSNKLNTIFHETKRVKNYTHERGEYLNNNSKTA
jgi:hypothetical protein